MEGQLSDRIDADHAERMKPRPANPDVTLVSHVPEPAAAPVPAPKPKIACVASMSLFPPRTLRSEAEVDDYLAEVRERMLAKLQGNDGLKFN